MKHSFQLLTMCFLLVAVAGFAQTPPEKPIKIIVGLNHADWTYKLGEKATFTVTVFKNGNPVPDARVFYEVGPEKMQPIKKDSLTLVNGNAAIDGGTLQQAGFLRCTISTKIDGVRYTNLATAGFNPADIKPTVTMPNDFDQFWEKAKAELAKTPIDARMRLLPERCTGNVNVYEVSLANINNSRFYGIVCIPKKEGKYPAVLLPPGAGVRPYTGDVGFAEKGVITLQVGIHGIPVTMDESVYKNLAAGALKEYHNFNLDDKDKYYFKRVYMGCIRANDFLTSLPQFDGEHLGVFGSSQGGALSIVTAALDGRVKVLAAIHPAHCDMTGFLFNRAGGYPQFFYTGWNNAKIAVKEKVETIGYYDVVNFSKELKVEGWYSWGYNDEVCSPTSLYSAYNSISAPKLLTLSLETGHYIFPETYTKVYDWLYGKLTTK